MNDLKAGRTRNSPLGVSASELSDFLSKLALVYSSDVYGNPRLAKSLSELAQAVRREDPRYVSGSRKSDKRRPEVSPKQLEDLRLLNRAAIKAYLADEAKTKEELLALASARFSIPTSQLRKQRIEEVRAALMSALLHESSIEILSDEAGKDGANRSS